MKVFLSWSGTLSHKVANLLRDFLPSVIQAVEPWLSSEDIAPGARWFEQVSQTLESVDVGIIVLTAENIDSKWLNFEAGAISKHPRGARLCIFSVGVPTSAISGPLSQFQTTTASREGTLQLMRGLNQVLGNKALPEERLKRVFEVWWPSFETQFQAVLAESVSTTQAAATTAQPDNAEILAALNQILQRLDALERALPPTPPLPGAASRVPGPRPRVFIGSSSEALPVAEAIQFGLHEAAECTIWHQGVFELGATTIESIVESSAKFDFAVLVLTPDDTTFTRGKESKGPRDNLVFELGLFTGILGRARTILVHPRDPGFRLPSDLAGVTTATYTMHSDGNLQAALGPVCTRIKRVMGAAQ